MTTDSDKNHRFDQRLPGLDFLRFVAVVLVLGRHLPQPSDQWPAFARSILNFWRTGGWVGVDIFFVLSGFLVSGLLLRELKIHNRISIGRFYLRRGWKIYPPFYALMLVTLVSLALRGTSMPLSEFVSEMFFLQSYLPGYFTHTWSLAVEEHFYLALPLIILLLSRLLNGRSPLAGILLVTVVTSVACLAMRIASQAAGPPHERSLFQTHLRLDSLMFGVLISAAFHYKNEQFIRFLKPCRSYLIGAGCGLLAIPFVCRIESSIFLQTFGLTVFYFASGMLLSGILFVEIQRYPPLMAMAWIGSFSYSIYLWHIPVYGLGVGILQQLLGSAATEPARLIFQLAGSIVVGIVMAKAVEMPALALRDRWFPSRSKL